MFVGNKDEFVKLRRYVDFLLTRNSVLILVSLTLSGALILLTLSRVKLCIRRRMCNKRNDFRFLVWQNNQ